MIVITFKLPEELIAQQPVHPRDSARLLVYERKTKKIVDAVFRDLTTYVETGSTLVINNSKVEHCRWLFNDGKTEIFVLEKLDTRTIRALIRPGKKFRLNQKASLTDWLTVEVIGIDDDGIRTLKLSVSHDDSRLKEFEHVPLPLYIEQNDKLAEEYQTVYAKPLGSKAAPTAGLHFTDELLKKVSESHDILEVTLHVGLGTFAPLTDENYSSGTLHTESYEIDSATARKLANTTHTTAVGTTTTRTLESWAKSGKNSDATDIFIQPGYEFNAVDSLITNFHLPGTSLLLMIEAFIGSREETQRIYDHAIAQKYRFYSFGDAMLIL